MVSLGGREAYFSITVGYREVFRLLSFEVEGGLVCVEATRAHRHLASTGRGVFHESGFRVAIL